MHFYIVSPTFINQRWLSTAKSVPNGLVSHSTVGLLILPPQQRNKASVHVFFCLFLWGGFLPWSFVCHCQYALQYIVCSKKHVYLHRLVHADLYIHSFAAFPHRPPPPHNVPACMATNEKPLRHLHLHTVHVPCSASLPTHTVTQNLTSSHASLSSLSSSHGSNCSQSVWLNILIWFKVI